MLKKKRIYYIAGTFLCSFIIFFAFKILLPSSKEMKPKDGAPNIDWADYGRIDPDELDIKLANKKDPKDADSVVVVLEIKNVSQRMLHLFKIRTGFEGSLFNDVFELYYMNNEVDYTGELKSISLTPSWYVDLQPGQTFTTQVKLNDFYDIPKNIQDKLIVRYVGYEPSQEIEIAKD